jgi:hypothetical protein
MKHYCIVLFAILALCSCASAPVMLSVSHPAPISFTSNINRKYYVVKHFSLEQKEPFLFLQRLFFAGKPKLDKMLEKELKSTDFDAIVNLKITGAASAGDISLPVVLGLGGALLISPSLLTLAFLPLFEDLKTYTIEGDAVKYADDVLPVSQFLRFDPSTGLPLKSDSVRFDPNTGLPLQRENK